MMNKITKNIVIVSWVVVMALLIALIATGSHSVAAQQPVKSKTTQKKKCKKKRSGKKLKIQPVGKPKPITKYAPTNELTQEEKEQRYTLPWFDVQVLDYKDPE